jgi:hypothetical protein
MEEPSMKWSSLFVFVLLFGIAPGKTYGLSNDLGFYWRDLGQMPIVIKKVSYLSDELEAWYRNPSELVNGRYEKSARPTWKFEDHPEDKIAPALKITTETKVIYVDRKANKYKETSVSELSSLINEQTIWMARYARAERIVISLVMASPESASPFLKTKSDWEKVRMTPLQRHVFAKTGDVMLLSAYSVDLDGAVGQKQQYQITKDTKLLKIDNTGIMCELLDAEELRNHFGCTYWYVTYIPSGDAAIPSTVVNIRKGASDKCEKNKP